MDDFQAAIFDERSSSYYALEYRLRPGQDDADWRRALAALRRELSPQVQALFAFGPQTWARLSPSMIPENFIPFYTIHGPEERSAPGTQVDLLLWLHASGPDLVFQAAMQAQQRLGQVAVLELEVPGFRYLDSRDLTGFIDGTENPHETEAREVALIPPGKGGAGGSFVLAQKWVHRLSSWHSISEAEQERVIGRTKADSVELDDAPADCHVRRTDVKLDGLALKIYRRSFAYGTLAEQGLYFLGFSAELIRFAIQLDRMFGCAADGLHDRLTDYSQAVSGSYCFAPPASMLDELFT